MELTKDRRQLADRALVILGVTAMRPPSAAGTETSAALVLRVLKKLQVVGDGQDPSAEERDNLRVIIAPVVAGLAQRGIVNFTDIEAIPRAQFEPLADILAFKAAPDHGKIADPSLLAFAQKGEADLRTMTAMSQLDDAIDAVLEDLNLRGIIEVVEADAIPVGLFEGLARVLASAVATSFGQPENEAAREAYEERLRIASRRIDAPSRTLGTDSFLRVGARRC